MSDLRATIATRLSLPTQTLPAKPALVVLVSLAALLAGVIATSGGDPLALARLGTRYSQGDPAGSEGYDGQFTYYLSLDLRPEAVAPRLDVAPYRYQRILMPVLARMLSFGSVTALPWVLAGLGVLAQALGTWFVARLLQEWGASPWYALAYGLFAGFTLAARLDLPEPLAYALVAAALWAGQRGSRAGSWCLYGLALFAKEVTVVFVAAELLALLAARRWRDALAFSLIALAPYLLFQGWLWMVFGSPGIGSGGAMATPFERIPFMGLLRIGVYSPVYLAGMLVVFGPAVVLPACWGFIQGLKSLFSGDRNVIVLAVLLNAVMIALLPFSTFRETGGLLRLACGLVLSILLFAARRQDRGVLNLCLLWLVLNVFLLK